jgi:hypothetical protein
MTLFAPDLYRNFAFGFAAGGLIVAAATAEHWAPSLESPLQAASPLGAPPASAEFTIEPLEGIAQ